jgi:hypothetical protein
MKNPQKRFWQLMFVTCLLFVGGSTVSAQGNEADFSKFLQAQQQDASKLVSAYTEPAIKAISYGMTSGWYTTGKTHSKLGFDISVTMSAVFTPTSDDYFTPATLGLTNTTMTLPSANGQAPTIMGPKTATAYQSVYTQPGTSTTVTTSFSGPEGLDFRGTTGFSAVPVPMVQVGLGLLWNTDLKVRFIPEREVGSSKISMLGFGLLHDIKQHIPGIKMLPIDISLLAAFNTVNGTTSLVHTNTGAGDTQPASPDGKGTYKLNSWVVQGIVSKKFSVITLYAGVGYGNVSSKVDITGTYTVLAAPANFPIKDPVAVKFDNNSMKLTGGIRFKFGPVYLSGDYTVQTYNALSLGFGFSVR